MANPKLVQGIALGLGAGGALVDVTRYSTSPAGVTYAYGRQSEFRDPSPGQVTVTLDNYDGRFTPDNPGSPYATPLTEGTAVCWQAGTRLVTGYVTGIGFASSTTDWGRVAITVGDAFQSANRTPVGDLAAAIGKTGAYRWWPMTDAAQSQFAAEVSGNGGPPLGGTSPSPLLSLYGIASMVPAITPVFGAASTAPSKDEQAQFSYGVGIWTFATYTPGPPIVYPPGSAGAWGLWVTPVSQQFTVGVAVSFANGRGVKLALTNNPGAGSLIVLASGAAVGATDAYVQQTGFPFVTGQAHYFSFATTYTATTVTLSVLIDGVLVGASTVPATLTPAAVQPAIVQITVGDNTYPGTVLLSHLSHQPSPVNEAAAGVTTLPIRAAVLAQLIPQIGTISVGAVSTAPVDATANVSTVWSGLCDVLRTEQGHLYQTTTGTLTAPVTTTTLRERTRPSTVALTIDAAADIEGIPTIVRDLTDLAATVTATGPTANAIVADRTLVSRVGNSSASEQVLLQQMPDLTGWAQDRMLRGKNISLKVTTVTVNTLTSTVTPGQIMALNLGDRIRISGLPAAQLGFTTWDGWFVGASESHNQLQDLFTLHLAPVLPGTAVYDADIFGADGELTLSGAITAAATSLVFATSTGTTLSTAVPYSILVESERMTVTAVAGTTLTVTRGQGGTTAAAHPTGVLIDTTPVALYAF